MKRPALFSTAEVAEMLGVDESHVRYLARSRDHGFKVGARWCFSKRDIRRMENRAPVGRPRIVP